MACRTSVTPSIHWTTRSSTSCANAWLYVKAAARFKPTESSIAAPERVAQMLPQRREWAEQAGLDPHFVETLFAQIIHWYIGQQVLHWRAMRTLA